MSAITTNQYYDFLNHCDNECKHIITPYIDGIQRMLFEQRNNNPYYEIPFVIKSICSAYYCKHIQYTLSFKTLFTQYPHDYYSLSTHDPHCDYNWKSCPSIQRITHILTNFQSYLVSSDDVVSPYITYKHYQIKQILSDIKHINHEHSQNSVKFYIRNTIMRNSTFECTDVCSEYERTCTMHLQCTDMEEWIKYNIFRIHEQFIHHSESKEQFECAASHIITYNESEYIHDLLNTLKSVAKKLYTYDIKYRTLDTTNPMVQRRVLGFEGVLHFLSLLGFESNALGTKLMCHHPPSIHVIQTAIAVINAYYPRTATNVQQSELETNEKHVHIPKERQKHEHIMIQMMDTMMCVNPLSVGESQIHQITCTDGTKESVFGSLVLESSDTEYIDIEDYVAVSMEKGDNDKRNGIRRWFGHKWSRMNGKKIKV